MMKVSNEDRIIQEPKKRGFFSRLIRGTVKLLVIFTALIIAVGFAVSFVHVEKIVAASEKSQTLATKPAKKTVKTVVMISNEEIRCYAAFSLMRDIYFSTEWSMAPNGTYITKSDYQRITDIQSNMPISIGNGPEHKRARLGSYEYKKTIKATPDKIMVLVIECMSLYE